MLLFASTVSTGEEPNADTPEQLIITLDELCHQRVLESADVQLLIRASRSTNHQVRWRALWLAGVCQVADREIYLSAAHALDSNHTPTRLAAGFAFSRLGSQGASILARRVRARGAYSDPFQTLAMARSQRAECTTPISFEPVPGFVGEELAPIASALAMSNLQPRRRTKLAVSLSRAGLPLPFALLAHRVSADSVGPAILREINSDDDSTSVAASKLAQYGMGNSRTNREALTQWLLDHPSSGKAASVFMGLTTMPDTRRGEFADLALRLLEECDFWLADCACDYLVEVGSTCVHDALRRDLCSGVSSDRSRWLLRAVARLDKPISDDLGEMIAQCLAIELPSRIDACHALGACGSQRHAGVLRERLETFVPESSEELILRAEIARAYARICNRYGLQLSLPRSITAVRGGAGEYAVAWSRHLIHGTKRDLVRLVSGAASSRDATLRRMSCYSIYEEPVGSKRYLAVTSAALLDADSDVRSAALHALLIRKNEFALELADWLVSGDERLGPLAVRVACNLRQMTIRSADRLMLRMDQDQVFEHLAPAYLRSGPTGLRSLSASLMRKKFLRPSVRLVTLARLVPRPDRELILGLRAALCSADVETRIAAFDALQELGVCD